MSGRQRTRHTPSSTCCWCNEAALLSRQRAVVPPIATESPSTVLLCPPQHFGALKATIPHLVAAAGSPALLALRDAMQQRQLDGQAALKKVPGLLKSNKPEASLDVTERWERLTRRLLPQRNRYEPTLSFTTSDYPARRPLNVRPQSSGRGAGPISAFIRPQRLQRAAQVEAKGWTKLNDSLRTMRARDIVGAR